MLGLGLAAIVVVRRTLAPAPPASGPPLRTQPGLAAPAPPLIALEAPEPSDAVPVSPPPSAAPETMPNAPCPIAGRPLGPTPERGLVSVRWYEGGGELDAARREQEAAAAPLLVYVQTDWCGYCRRLEREFLEVAPVEPYLRSRVVKLKVNPEHDAASRDLADRLGVTGYPSLCMATPGGVPLPFSPYARGTRFLTGDELIAVFERPLAVKAEELLSRARGLRASGRAGAAVPLLDQALRLAPDDVRLYFERGLAHAARGDPEPAFDDLARAASMIPEAPEPFEAADALLERLHRLDEAAACWTSYLERNRSDARGYRGRARALGRLGLPGLSAADATKACALGLSEACEPSTSS